MHQLWKKNFQTKNNNLQNCSLKVQMNEFDGYFID